VLLVAAAWAALVLALVMAVGAKLAKAAFPGSNGKIAFVSDRTTGTGVNNPTGDFEIFTMNPDGTGLTQLTNNTAGDLDPTWSADGTKTAFTRHQDANDEVYVMDANGDNQTRLTNNPASDFGPAWSADRTKIAFSSDRNGNFEIFIMNADGSNQTNRTNNSAEDREPGWQPT
jgi:TolB protein